MVDTPEPPVNEVVLSVALAQQSTLVGPLLADVLGEWFETHQGIQTAPRYEMPPEPEDITGQSVGPLQVITSPIAEPRYWLVSADDREVVQVQSNYLALSWRRRDLPPDYPGYPHLRSRFVDLLETASSGLTRHGGALQPTRAEITYINLVQPGADWSSHSDTHRLLKVSLGEDLAYERLALSFSQPIEADDARFAGRLHVVMQPGFDWLKQEQQFMLTITCRSSDLQEQTAAAALGFLDRAHDRANEVFLALITDTARRAWGLA